jgi:hypothetical protein
LARRTVDDQITLLEARRDSLEEKLEAHESYKSLKAQGNEGATTDFTDPLKLQEMLDKVNNKLALLYTRKDNG